MCERLEHRNIVRTAWLVGERGSNFVTSMLATGRVRDHLDVDDDQIGSPTATRVLPAGIVLPGWRDGLARVLEELGALAR